LTSFAILIATLIGLRFYLIWCNRQRAAVRDSAIQDGHSEAVTEYDFMNLTDRENPVFVYVY
jgi:hypothetical protein